MSTTKNRYLFARELEHRFLGTSRIEQTVFELTAPFEFAFSNEIVAYPFLGVWQFPDYDADGQPATQLVGYVHDPRDRSVQHSAFVLETWTGTGTTTADALLNAEVFGAEGNGYKIW